MFKSIFLTMIKHKKKLREKDFNQTNEELLKLDGTRKRRKNEK